MIENIELNQSGIHLVFFERKLLHKKTTKFARAYKPSFYSVCNFFIWKRIHFRFFSLYVAVSFLLAFSTLFLFLFLSIVLSVSFSIPFLSLFFSFFLVHSMKHAIVKWNIENTIFDENCTQIADKILCIWMFRYEMNTSNINYTKFIFFSIQVSVHFAYAFYYVTVTVYEMHNTFIALNFHIKNQKRKQFKRI